MKRATRKLIKDYFFTICIAVAIAFLIRKYLVEAYRVPSLAMKPTLVSGDTLFVAKWPLFIQKDYIPERGDVIAFSSISGIDGSTQDFIRRVVGIPGDTVEIQKGLVFLNGKKLVQSLPPEKTTPENTSNDYCPLEQLPGGRTYRICLTTPSIESIVPEKVPLDSVYVIGDLRGEPEKKIRRGWGLIPREDIKGKALAIWLSIENSKHGGYLSLPNIRWERMFQRIQ